MVEVGVQVGDTVLYALEDGINRGELRPAIVVRRWSDDPHGAVQLAVFVDGSNDYPGAAGPVLWKTSRTEGEHDGQYRRIWHDLTPSETD